MKKETPIYTTIFHKTRINLDLTCNEYCVADTIFCLSNNPTSRFSGWCYASKNTIGEFLGITKQCVHQIINKLIEKGLVEKEPETKYLKTTSLWYEKVIVERIRSNSKESLLEVKKVYSEQSIKFTPDSKESLHNNNNNNIDKDNNSGSALPSPPVILLKEKKLTPIQEFVLYYEQRFLEEISDNKPIVNFPKVAKLATPYLKDLGLERMKELVDKYLTTENKFYREVMWGIDIFLTSAVIHSLNNK